MRHLTIFGARLSRCSAYERLAPACNIAPRPSSRSSYSEVIIQHAPHTAKIGADETKRQVNDWLDGLEAHTATFVGPFLQQILDHSDPPEAVKALLTETIAPTAAFSATLEQIFLWGIVSSIINTGVTPFLVGLTNDLNAAAVSQGIARPVDPGLLATAAGRGFTFPQPPTVTVSQGLIDEVAKSGVSEDDLNLAASLVGLPPALQELFELYRRGDIDIDAVKQGLREGDFRDDWIDRTIGLAHAWLTPLDFVRAAVQAQMSYPDAQSWAYKTGLDTTTSLPVDVGDTEATPDMFGLAFSIAGRPPGPEQLGRMALRNIIPWAGTGAGTLSFQQGIAESDVKTKWTAALQQLETYVPPPRTVGTLLEHRGYHRSASQKVLGGQRGARRSCRWLRLHDAAAARRPGQTPREGRDHDRVLRRFD